MEPVKAAVHPQSYGISMEVYISIPTIINATVQTIAMFPSNAISESAWPAYDEQALVRTECELVVQVNGKLRDRIWMAMDASEEDAKALAFASEKIKELTEGKELRKVIYVPGKIMNLVVS